MSTPGKLPRPDKFLMRRCFRLGQIAHQDRQSDECNPFIDLRIDTGRVWHHPAYRQAWRAGWHYERDVMKAMRQPGYNVGLYINFPADQPNSADRSTPTDEHNATTE
jgi:hypothetical protein